MNGIRNDFTAKGAKITKHPQKDFPLRVLPVLRGENLIPLISQNIPSILSKMRFRAPLTTPLFAPNFNFSRWKKFGAAGY
jgi:hypothetical protein